ncbi:GDP-mannose mannosyl hydrolase [bacterium BMS3Abin05]|nr:GDP-mannose mannosyl hydrolase [bacterium BMS3Abin05]GBE26859.1 GDP-mannose mannosyl hydrolase [bacterium BMS3Bbin03]HDZ10589.1 NUDIX domain-containing protein [Bacteroidota bacterium]
MKRKFPNAPIPAVSGIVLNEKNEILAIRRGKNPGKGRWSLPGGVVRLGEPIQDALRREIREECGVDVAVLKFMTVFDRIFRNSRGEVEYHYVLVNFLCRLKKGTPAASSDAADVRWICSDDLDRYQWTIGVGKFLENFFANLVLPKFKK